MALVIPKSEFDYKPAAEHFDDGFSFKSVIEDNRKIPFAGGFGSFKDPTAFLNQSFTTLVGSDRDVPCPLMGNLGVAMRLMGLQYVSQYDC